MNSKNIEALKPIDFLEAFWCMIMKLHDHETATYHFGSSHAECNVHVDRYLKGIIELAESQWASAMRALLYEIKDATEQNGGALSESACAEYPRSMTTSSFWRARRTSPAPVNSSATRGLS